MTININNPDDGRYTLDGVVPTSFRKGDSIQIYAKVIVNGRTQKAVVSSFVLSGSSTAGQVWP
jgi:CRISPR/Cas system Type II protein with McrA/HNH and RuvC-like nuclease domain